MELAIGSTRLVNGLRVVRVFDPRAREIHVTMRYAVGAADDPVGQEGVAHLVEHLMFEQVVGAQTITAKLEGTARSYNAFTTYDATTYVTDAAAAQLDALLFIEFVRMNLRCASITESVFVREREVVLQELRMRDQGAELRAAMHRGVYSEKHPYARLLGGTAETVGALTLKQACAFADAHYGPSNAVLVVSGNIDAATLEASVAKFLAKVPQRAIAQRAALPAAAQARAVETNAPIDEDAVLIAWPLPVDVAERTRIAAVGDVAKDYIDAAVAGPVTVVSLGDARAPMLGVIVWPGDGETTSDIIKAVERALDRAPLYFRQRGEWGRIAFNLRQQSAIGAQFAAFENDFTRDRLLATNVHAGVAPQQALAASLQSLRTLTAEDAATLLSKHLAYKKANIVVLKASETTRGTTRGTTKLSTKLSTKEPVHDVGLRRDTDPALATQPATEAVVTRAIDGVITRSLPNGMRVILLPLTSVPVVDARIVFSAGTADELPERRGAGIVAAHGMRLSLKYINDSLAMAEAGATMDVSAGADYTTFQTLGLDMHLDYMLAGLRRIVREGSYEGASSIVKAMRDTQKSDDDEGARTDAWRTALYGKDHPYRVAGMSRHIARDLNVGDVTAFRRAYYTPDNATLIIAGKFDPAVANRWIDYLFADWEGKRRNRVVTPTTVSPASIAIDDDVAQTAISIAMPSTIGSRAQRLVVTEMLASIARDVRHQLGASYMLDADVSEQRRSSLYLISGSIDAPRTAEAIALIASRIEKLRSDPDASARAFVEARRSVLSHLGDIGNTASTLAERVADDIGLEREPLSDVKVAHEVHDLTIANVADVLAEIDLSRAAIAMRGPAADVDKAFAALGRTPRRIIGAVEDPFAQPDAPIVFPDQTPVYTSDVEDALTMQRRYSSLSFGASGGYATGKVLQHGGQSGPRVAAYAGYRIDESKALGVRASFMQLGGTYNTGTEFLPVYANVDATILSLGGYMHVTAFDRVYGGLLVTMNVDRTNNDGVMSSWSPGVAIGLESGLDVVRFGSHRVGLLGHLEGEVATDASWAGFSIGLGYRNF